MAKNKITVLALSALLSLGAVAGLMAGNKAILNSAAPCAHENVEHYSAVAPTTEAAGKHEHWACCDCGTRWTDEAKTNVTTNEALAIAKKTTGTAVAEGDVTDPQMLYLASNKLKCLEQTAREYVNIDGRLAARFSANESLFAKMDSSNYGATDFRFRFAGADSTNIYHNVYKITFEYKYWDINYEQKAESRKYTDAAHSTVTSPSWKWNTKVHTTTYDPIYTEDYIADNQWHTQTIEVDGRSIEFFQLMIYHFNGEMYVANVNFELQLEGLITAENATPAAGDMISNIVVYEKSVAAGASSDKKSIKNMTKTDAARYVTVADKNGVDRTALYFAAEMDTVTASDSSNNYGFAEFRIAVGTVDQSTGSYEKKAIKGLSFEYRYFDRNDVVNSTLGTGDKAYGMKSYVEYKTSTYTNETKPATHFLVRDTQWHTATVSSASDDFAAALVKIHQMNGELLVTNFQFVF